MSPPKVFYPSALVPPTGPPITQVEQIPLAPGFEDISVIPGGGVFPGFTGSSRSEPSFQVSTSQIKTVLDLCVQDSIAVGGQSANFDIEYQRGQNLQTRFPSSSDEHTRLRVTDWLFAWDSINAPENGLAEISTMLKPISDGTNPPVVRQSGVPLSAAPAVQHVYGVGPVFLNGEPICVESWSWQNNLTYKTKVCSGLAYLGYASVQTSSPIATIQTEDRDAVLSYLPSGSGQTLLEFYLRRKSQGGLNEPNVSPVHIRLAALLGTVKPDSDSALKVQVHSFTTDTAAAIPS